MSQREDVPLPADDFVVLHDEEIGSSELIAEVRRRMQTRRREPAYDPPPQFPTYAVDDRPPQIPEDIPYRYGLYYHLQRAHARFAEVETQPLLAPSPATQMPLLGRIWGTIRREAHQLVLFYVNRSLAHQTSVNRHLVGALGELVQQQEEQQRMIQQLQQEMATLRQERDW